MSDPRSGKEKKKEVRFDPDKNETALFDKDKPASQVDADTVTLNLVARMLDDHHYAVLVLRNLKSDADPTLYNKMLDELKSRMDVTNYNRIVSSTEAKAVPNSSSLAETVTPEIELKEELVINTEYAPAPSGVPVAQAAIDEEKEFKVELTTNPNYPLPQLTQVSDAFIEAYVDPHIEKMKQHYGELNEAYTEFASLMEQQPKGMIAFTRGLQYLTEAGALETGAKKTADTFYHDSPHPAELAHYVLKVMHEMHQPTIVTAITAAAAAYHDVVQGADAKQMATRNEVESAKRFAEKLQEELDKLKTLLTQGKTPAEAAKITATVDQFRATVPFLAEDLIVPTTYLIRPQNVAMLEVILEKAKDDKSIPTSPFQAGQRVLSVADTGISLFPEVLIEQRMLKALKTLPESSQEIIKQLVNELNLKDPEKQEAFLLRFMQSIRMLPELNKFKSGDNRLDDTEIKAIMQTVQQSRAKPEAEPTQLSADIFNKFAKALTGEKDFAYSLRDSGKILEGIHQIDTDGWIDHSAHIEKIKSFFAKITNPAEQATLMTGLVSLASHQRGVAILDIWERHAKGLENLGTVLKREDTLLASRSSLFGEQKRAPAPVQQEEPSLGQNFTRKT